MEYKRLAEIDTSSIQFEFLSNVSSYADKKETWLALGKDFDIFLIFNDLFSSPSVKGLNYFSTLKRKY